MNTSTIRKMLKINGVTFREEYGNSGFNYTRFVFLDLKTVREVEKLLGLRVTTYSCNFALVVY